MLILQAAEVTIRGRQCNHRDNAIENVNEWAGAESRQAPANRELSQPPPGQSTVVQRSPRAKPATAQRLGAYALHKRPNTQGSDKEVAVFASPE